LGGVNVPHEKGLLGHSDADVLTHAIMDSLLGAAGLPDIGHMFPDTDPAYKNISSLLLLGRVLEQLSRAGWQVINIDSIIAAQRPKLAPYIAQMRHSLADCLTLTADCVNVKATTEEGLGFTGAEDGISAWAVCLLSKE
jgi:2-C-methyl-D-erythritol 2,4-cyclodiphosphate synthase